MNHLQILEAEAIGILWETASQFRRPALLFSGGKDSTVLIRLAEKAFRPGKFPFPLLHVDTGHNFPETIEFRDKLVSAIGETLIVRYVQDGMKSGKIPDPGQYGSRNTLQSVTLLDAISELQFDAVLGGARRDEEKARAKERIFSFRDEFGQWEPRSQRPELWNLYNGRVQPGQHMRVFPLSNWTELDIWNYIREERIEIPTIYFSHKKTCVRRKNGVLLAECPFVKVGPEDAVEELVVRCRTVGDMTCTGLLESTASNIDEIIREVVASRTTERGTRHDDKISDTAMEDRKRQGYF